MNKAEELYTKKASLYHWFFIKFLRYENGLKKFFKTNKYLKQNDRVLDAGCGSGVLTRVLSEIAKNQKLNRITFHGFDLTQAMLNLFDRWISGEKLKNISLEKADVLKLNEQLPNEWKNYDLIVSSAMLEYIPKSEVKKAFRNLYNLLKDDGTFCLFITRRNLLTSVLIKWWWNANIYKKEEIKQILTEAGFKNIRFKKFLFPYNYLNLWGFSIEATK